MARWERICRPLQETEVQSLIWGDPARFSAAKSVGHTVEPVPVSPGNTATRARVSWSPRSTRGHRRETPSTAARAALLPQLEEGPGSHENPAQPAIKKQFNKNGLELKR